MMGSPFGPGTLLKGFTAGAVVDLSSWWAADEGTSFSIFPRIPGMGYCNSKERYSESL